MRLIRFVWRHREFFFPAFTAIAVVACNLGVFYDLPHSSLMESGLKEREFLPNLHTKTNRFETPYRLDGAISDEEPFDSKDEECDATGRADLEFLHLSDSQIRDETLLGDLDSLATDFF